MDIFDLAKEGKINKIFRAREKLSFPGAMCHITQHSAGKDPLFLEESDYLYMLYLLKKHAKKYEFDILAFSLMPNHLHIFIRLGKDNLSRSMQGLFTMYAKYFNKKYVRKGHVFSGRFRQSICLDEAYLIVSSLYIHLNAIRAKLTDGIGKYRWSSCKLYLEGLKDKQTFVDYRFILSILDNSESKAREVYRRMLEEALKVEVQEEDKINDSIDSFKKKIIKNFPNIIKHKVLYENVTNKNILENEEINKEIDRLREGGRLKSPETQKSRLFVIQHLQSRGYNQSKIASKLGLSRQAVYKILKTAKK